LFITNELRKRFKTGEFVFVSDMGDLFGKWVKLENIMSVLRCIARWPETTFLLQTKNPARFLDVHAELPHNVYLGTTIETNDYYHGLAFDSLGARLKYWEEHKITDAPSPFARYQAITDSKLIKWPKFISIEPIIDFDLDRLTRWMTDIKPQVIEVGADNYHNHLPEPPWSKVQALLENLRRVCPRVEEKQGLERLKGVSRRQGENQAQRVSRERRENHLF